MNTTKQKVLKNFNYLIIILTLFLITGCENKFKTHKFYYLNFNNEIQKEEIEIPKKYTKMQIIEEYLLGPVNRKNFSSYFLNINSIIDFIYQDNILTILLNDTGYEILENLTHKQVEEVCKPIYITFLEYEDINIETIRIGYEKSLLIYKFTYSNVDK